MTPYLQSGRTARARLERACVPPGQLRLMSSLRAFKSVINIVCAFGLVLIPLSGALGDARIAAVVALKFLFVILSLELLERQTKRALAAQRRAASSQ